MIDFRYHLVSLVSVFLALAVGIVLGAGPLKESLGDTLAEQVQALRADREGLRADLARAGSSVEHRDDFLAAVAPKLVGGQLGGRSVAVVALPGADKDTIEAIEASLGESGAVVTGRIELTDAWTDPDQASALEQLTRQLAPTLLPASEATAATAGRVLAAVLVTGEIAESALSEAGSAALARLRDERLIRGDRLPTQRATAAVVVAPSVPTDAVGQDLQRRRDAAPLWRDLAAGLDAGSDGVVVEGPASAASPGGVLEQLRDGDARKRVSTVDTGGTPMGPVATVLALAEQLRGLAGHYGFADRATDPLPAATSGASS